MKTSMLLLLFILNYLPNAAQETGTFKDPRDGKVYKTVKIESQWIMAENLAYKSISGNFWTYDNKPNNLEKYGYMYDWETAKIIAPKGWHLPSKEEWEQFYKALGNDASKVYDDGKYSFEGSTAHFWSSTAESEFNAWNFNCYGDDKLAIINRHRKLSGLSVRLLQDK
jgi:hypothetical protein